MSSRRIVAIVALSALGALLVSACGSDNDTAPRARPGVVAQATDTALTVPSLLPAGWVDVTLHNVGRDDHEIAFVKLGPMSYDDFATAARRGDFRRFPPETVFVGGPGTVGAGKTVTANVHLDAGSYGVACFIRDPGDRRNHASRGQVARIEVEPSPLTSAAAPTSEGGTIELKEFDFTVPAGFKGAGTVAFHNAGTQVHEARIYKTAPGAGIGDARNYLLTPPGREYRGTVPVIPIGGIAGISPGQTAYTPLLLAQGDYLLVDALPDPTRNNVSHAAEGMIKVISIS